MRHRDRHRLRAWIERWNRARLGDQCQPDYGQRRGKRRRRRPAIPSSQRHRCDQAPQNSERLEFSDCHQQHHRQQHRRLGRRWNIARRCVGGEHNYNTIVSNDATATAGVLFNTLGAPLASSGSPPPNQTTTSTSSAPQPAGLASMRNSTIFTSALGALPAGTTLTCPTNHPGCASFSNPYLANNVFWQNRSFYIGVGALSPKYQLNVVAIRNALSGSQVASQPQADATRANGRGVVITGGTGACVSGSTYWDIGVPRDKGPVNHGPPFRLPPTSP